MTCIVGLEANGKVLMGSDGCASGSYMKFRYDEPKLFIKSGILFGYTTSFRFADIIQYLVKIPPKKKGVGDKEYLVTGLVPEIRNKLKENGFVSSTNGREGGGTALIAYNNKLYQLQDDFSIVRNECGYDSCGSGTYYALGSLHTTRDMKLKPEQRVRLALESATEHAVGVTEPLHFMWNR